MKRVITQTEFDNLPIVDGIKQCPTADYYMIKVFKDNCNFDLGSSFRDRVTFRKQCTFSKWNSFGEHTYFNKACTFETRASFGEQCTFTTNCTFEGGYRSRTNNPYFAVDRVGSTLRKAYFFDFEEGIYIRAGCFFGKEKDFLIKLERDNDVHKTAVYTAALALAKLQFGVSQ